MMKSDIVIRLTCGCKSRFSLMHKYEREYTKKGKVEIGYICPLCAQIMIDKGEKVKKVDNADKV